MTLRADDIHVRFGTAEVLKGPSLAVAPGEVVAVLGPNGAGKSTLLSVLSGALTPQGGQAALEGKALAHWPPSRLARRRAVLPQHSELSFGFPVLEVVLLGRSPHAGTSSREEDLFIAQACLAEAEVTHLAQRVYTTLSGGERQRVQLARALAQIDFPEGQRHHHDRYLLLDEPTSSLDLAHQHATLRTARRAAARGIGVLAILHDLNLAAMYADRLVVLHGGALAAAGTPEAVLTEDLVRRAFDLQVVLSRHPTRGCPQMMPV
ncbi:heme ABC transporter ATP-binding protein [Pelagibius marinus]|uniref:heme ABC transporter ATP-binding protein n=1 Tax=Pelagibius marinus TaxID=2762760 RepID=UPI0029CA7C34|nr:heme ABC transporter ATP-binding protein [Pelagibius marinus]